MGFGLGFAGDGRRGRDRRVTGSVGEYGWAGAAKTYYWVDPAEELVGLFMSQYMTGPLLPDRDFRSLVVSGHRRLNDRLGDPVDDLVEDLARTSRS